MLNKQKWLDYAEVTDSLRIFPRLIVAGYGAWTVWFIDQMWKWYETLPGDQRGAQVTMVIGSVSGGVFGLAAWVVKLYLGGGRDWPATPVPQEPSSVEWNLPDNKEQEQC